MSSLRLLIPRLRLLQKKDTASSVVQRRELAQLLEEGREASARIRVENVISTDIAVEVMEMVELYCELLLARANVLDQVAFGEKGAKARNRAKDEKNRYELEKRKASGVGNDTAPESGGSRSFFGFFGGGGSGQQSKQPATQTPTPPKTEDPDDYDSNSYMDAAIDEAALSVFYAWPRFPHDVRELTIVRTLLGDRYGKDFMALAQENKVENVSVPERLAKSLRVRPPSQDLVDSYLREIARAYGIAWGEDREGVINDTEELGSAPEFIDDTGTGTGIGNGTGTDNPDPPSTPPKEHDTKELSKTSPPHRPLEPGKSPVRVAPPAPRTDNPHPRVKVPPGSKPESKSGSPSVESKDHGDDGVKKIPEVDELSRRFAALRR